jgi:hypothetical protein
MFIIFGTRRMRKSLGTVLLLCQRCQRPSAHAVFKLHTWFTLFFIPVFPFNVKYATACPMCGVGTQIDRSHAEHLESVAAQQNAAPVEMTPDGPLTPGAMSAAAPSAGDQPPAEGWWMASDEKWYPPELHPDAR